MELNQTIMLEQLHFTGFNKKIKVEWNEMVLFNSSCWYEIIMGGEFLQKAGININYAKSQVEWLDGHLPLQNSYEFYKEEQNFLVYMLYAQE